MSAPVAVTHTFVQGVASSAPDVNTNFTDLTSYINSVMPHLDGSKAFTGAVSLPGNPSTALQAAPKQYVDSIVPVGTVTCYAGATAPNPNYLLCQGQAISRTTYSALFAAIGTTYGTGDGSSTFNIPDLRGRTAIGSGTGSGLSARTLGAAHGTETHPLVTGEMPFHNHTITHPNVVATADGVHLHSPSGGVTNFVTADSNPGASIATVAGPGTVSQNSTTTSNGSHTHAINGVTDFAGAGTGHNNMQPSRVLNYIIKVL